MKAVVTILVTALLVGSCAPPRHPRKPPRPPRPPHVYVSPYHHHDNVKNEHGIRSTILRMSFLC